MACCMAIRLARFNADLTTKDQNDPLVKYFFKGIPAPAAAVLTIWPLVLFFRFGQGIWSEPIFVIANTTILALLAGSTIPTPCFKKVKVPTGFKNLVLIISAMFVITLILDPWMALSILGTLYLISIVIGLFFYLSFKRQKSK